MKISITAEYIKISLILVVILSGFQSCDIRRPSKDRFPAEVKGPVLSSELHVGFAKVNITPPVGMRLCGTFEERLGEGIHDSLYVRAFVFKQGEVRFTIAGCDLAMVFPEICDSVRHRVSDLGLAADHVLIHGSETHNGPDYFGEFRDVFHERALNQYGYDPAETLDYGSFLIDKITKAINSANESLQASDIYFSSGECTGIAFNRRFRMKDGSVGWNPGKLNPEIIEPLGPVDECVPVLSIFQGNSEVTYLQEVFLRKDITKR